MDRKNIFFAHSGGVTAVINTIACGVIQTARKYPHQLGNVYAGQNGILGAINEALIDTSQWSDSLVKALYHTPSSAFGSCRYKIEQTSHHDVKRIFEVFAAHDIGYFIYNGGNDSQDTTHKIDTLAQQHQYPLKCIGIPKTIDNDLACTDTCPGFGSAAKYIATSVREASLDVQAMSASSTQVFILEVMGRHAGWLAAAGALAQQHPSDPPHIILLPEVPFNREIFLQAVQDTVQTKGYCVIVASEGLSDTNGQHLSQTQHTDAFGHTQLGGVAPKLAHWIQTQCQLKTHWASADYLQRSARHLASACDVKQSHALGCAAIEAALTHQSGIMLTLERIQDNPYQWRVGQAPLDQIANIERKLPAEFIASNGLHVTPMCQAYLRPLILGESPPPYAEGIPAYPAFPHTLLKQHCPRLQAECAETA